MHKPRHGREVNEETWTRWSRSPAMAHEKPTIHRQCRWSLTELTHRKTNMYFTNDSLFPENMQPLIITVAPFGPEWLPRDCDLPVSWDEQVQTLPGNSRRGKGRPRRPTTVFLVNLHRCGTSAESADVGSGISRRNSLTGCRGRGVDRHARDSGVHCDDLQAIDLSAHPKRFLASPMFDMPFALMKVSCVQGEALRGAAGTLSAGLVRNQGTLLAMA